MSQSIAVDAPIVVFFDGGCGLCRREIRLFKRLDSAQRVQWIDISRDQTLLNALGVSWERGMQSLHVLDGGGILRDGARAFIALWSVLPYHRHLARLILWTRTTTLLDRAYRRFAGWRYARRRRQSACPVSAQM